MKLEQLNYQHEMEELETMFKQVVYLKKQSSFLSTAHFAKRNSTTIWMQLHIFGNQGEYSHKSIKRAIDALWGHGLLRGGYRGSAAVRSPRGESAVGSPRTSARSAAAGDAGAGARRALRMFPERGRGSWG